MRIFFRWLLYWNNYLKREKKIFDWDFSADYFI